MLAHWHQIQRGSGSFMPPPTLRHWTLKPSGRASLATAIAYAQVGGVRQFLFGNLAVSFLLTGTTTDPIFTQPVKMYDGGVVYDIYLAGTIADNDLTAIAVGTRAVLGPPAGDELDYLLQMKETREFSRLLLTTYDDLLLDPTAGTNDWYNRLALVFSGWVIVDNDIRKLAPPNRYKEIHVAFLAAVEPFSIIAKEMTGVEEWLSGDADFIDLSGFDPIILLQVILETRPLTDSADALLDAALSRSRYSFGITMDERLVGRCRVFSHVLVTLPLSAVPGVNPVV